ncbi:hypothetical protein D9615_004336 [Tricholomella constricta]|uniref:LsmAD domain-containing protein n=1 Tax=Tricholomella constricta TaxID=117010 RepID=A0A8H5HF74_9AGAR|nr:hypothetical protein D9615_004336 [Tricholomella constricta]
MATAARQNKPARKGAPEPARRIPAWTGARASPTYTPPPNAPTRTQGAASPVTGNFPPLAQANGSRADAVQDRVLQSLSGLTGTTVTVCTKTSQRYEGVIASTGGEGDTTGVTLKDVKEISSPGAPLKDQLFIASTNIDTWSSGPADAKPPNGDYTDISQRKGAGRERELQQWSAGPDAVPATDDDTFGPLNNTSWDQFAVNEKLFGVKTNFDENLYTTKLDRSAADFKERERNAQRIANEIIGATSSNPHIAEERNQTVDDSGINEEDKYGAVVRGTNAYVPPGARKPGALSPPVNNAAAAPTTAKVAADIPKVSVNGPDGAKLPSLTQSPSSSKAPSPAPVTKPADALPAFRDFVTNEKQRLTQKRQALVKNEMDKRMAELVKFSQNFKLNKPIPDDLVPILAKDEEKQRAIREKATKDAASAQARTIGATTPANAARGAQVAAAKISGPQRPALTPAAKTATNSVAPAQASVASKFAASTKPTPTSEAAAKKPSMFIQAIPPFKGAKARQSSGPAPANGAPAANAATPPSASGSANAGNMSPATAANRLNVNASSFRPNAKANAFTPGAAPPNNAAAASASVSPKPKPETTPNPFFGTRPIKKSQLVNIKDDFNPFKHNKVVEAAQISGLWPYNGKRYAQMFPQPQHQPQHQQPHNMPAPGPPPIPPPSYEEDSAAQAAARGYVYAYPPYGYPGQPMMPSMAPPGPPGAYMPGPYMQPMQYPPGMPPPNAMYTPAMGQMPPQAYMPPPPPGPPYPPPNGAGPRPSVPSTPMPAHVHQYYHQSPQRMIPFDQYTGKMFTMPMPTVQHAVPYHMMMPPPNVPQHPYDGGPAPPVQMGGHA